MTEQDKQQLKIAGAVLGGVALLYILFKSKLDNSGGSGDPTGNDSPYLPEITFNAQNVADDLFEYMNQLGTDESGILQTLKSVTAAQFAKVVTAFGRKKYNTWLGNDSGYFLDTFTLKQWLKNELSDNDYAILKIKYPNSL